METREETEARETKVVDDTKTFLQGLVRKVTGINITNPLAGLDALPTTEESLDPDSLKVYQDVNKPVEQSQSIAKEGLQTVTGIYGAALGAYGTIANQPRNIINITPTNQTQIPKYSSGQVVQTSKGPLIRLDPGTLNVKDTLQYLMSKIDPTYTQGEFFTDVDAVSRNLPDFITYPMARDMPAYSKEVPAGYVDYYKMRNWFYASETSGRKALETYMTPVVPGTQISRGVSFGGLAKAELPKLKRDFAPILKALKIDNVDSANIHHIAALKATFGILHKVQYDSPLYREVYDTLLQHIPGLGNMGENLVPVIGRTKGKAQVSTPHYLVHRFYADKIGESGELFFTEEVLNKMVKSKAYRLEKANELGKIIARSEQIVKDAQRIWRLGFSQENIHFEVIVNELSKLDELGYSKLSSTEYQTSALSEMIKDIVTDLSLIHI